LSESENEKIIEEQRKIIQGLKLEIKLLNQELDKYALAERASRPRRAERYTD